MFESQLKEAAEGRVEIKEFSPDVVEAAINYCYDQNTIEDNLSLADKLSLLYFADMYDIYGLTVSFFIIFSSALLWIYNFF